MGVHISFVRSTVLDTWKLNQLRNMKLGGNNNARIFFNKHGGIDKYSDMKEKYQSETAKLYKEHLNKLVEEDIKKYPDQIVIEDNKQEDSQEDISSSLESSNVSTPKSLSSSSLNSTPAPIPLKPRGKHTPGSLLKPKNKKNAKASKVIKGVNFEEVAKRVQEQEKKKQKEENKKNKNDKEESIVQLLFLLFICAAVVIFFCNIFIKIFK